ncbi:NGG1p interacting factor NIF3 [Exilibacterium tricleocarpae]|uniref:NGG1p interacting factor NIF3 n=1 Tax=Exilibacterium tricleocarpae TaxID=2591008 RepID=A0A545SMB0_9GAMM|nr:YqfO family protein [Exilibacterium tricleocarpae]TQV66132.1 NGG1p interacting factor NIF3 [Exilibacterium tricleocarpae]
MYKLCFYVPESHLEMVKQALFDAGAGRIGNYDCCAWQTPGQGQFRPLAGSEPFIGRRGEVEIVAEFKVEMVCAADKVSAAVAALRRSHPYEEPAYDVWSLATPD